MRKVDLITQMKEAVQFVFRDVETWQKYLKFSSQLYKTSFEETTQLYYLNQSFTYVATFDDWRKYYRYVRRGEKSTLVGQLGKTQPIISKHYFDVSQTYGKQLEVFSFSGQNQHQVLNQLLQEIFKAESSVDNLSIEDFVEKTVNHVIDKQNNDIFREYQFFIIDSILAKIIYRTEWEHTQPIIDMIPTDSLQNMFAIGQLVTVLSQEILVRAMKYEKQYQKQLKEEAKNEGQIWSRDDNDGRPRLDSTETDELRESRNIRTSSVDVSLREQSATSVREDLQSDNSIVSGGKRESSNGTSDSHSSRISNQEPMSTGRGVSESHRMELLDPSEDRRASSGLSDTNDSDYENRRQLRHPERNIENDKEDIEDHSISSFVSTEQERLDLGLIDLEVIEYFLIHGGNTEKHRMKVLMAAAFVDENQKDFLESLKKIYHHGNGFELNGQKYAAWFDENGLKISMAQTTMYQADLQLTWQEILPIINRLIAQGIFATKQEVQSFIDEEIESLAEAIVFIDFADDTKSRFFAPFPAFCSETIFSKSKQIVLDILTNVDQRKEFASLFKNLLKAFYDGEQVLRFRSDLETIFWRLERLSSPLHLFASAIEKIDSPTAFITQDEIDWLLLSGSGFESGNYRIYHYFQSTANREKRVAFLKNEFGIGGKAPAISDDKSSMEMHDAKGIRLSKRNCEEILLKWPIVEKTIQTLIDRGRYLSLEAYENWLDKQANKQNVVESIDEELLPTMDDNEQESIEDSELEIAVDQFSDTENLSTDTRSDNEQLDLFATFDDSLELSDGKVSKNELVVTSSNYHPKETVSYASSKKEKALDNLQAIQCLKQLEQEQRATTEQEQVLLAKYSGWGGIPEIFEVDNSDWQALHQQLAQLLTPEEYRAAQSSVLTAFYTPSEVIKKIYEHLSHLGDFSQGSILDPAMGTGNFFANLPEKMTQANLIGVEIDTITSKIAKYLYPESTILQTGFENVELSNKADLVVGNFPFSDITVLDKKYQQYNFKIHDYFMAKSIDLLAPKGYLVFITSTGTMDKRTKKAREYLAKRANLVGALRLPNHVFKNSGTEVVSDILIFQKKTYEEMIHQESMPSWLEAVPHPDFPGLYINQYFIEHPEYILGEVKVKNFHGLTIDVVGNTDTFMQQLDTVLADIVSKQSSDRYYVSENQSVLTSEITKKEEITIPIDTEEFTYFESGNRIFYYKMNGEHEEVPSKQKAIIQKMIPLREAIKTVLEIQRNENFDQQLFGEALSELNTTYDSFVKQFGAINHLPANTILKRDKKYPLLTSIERVEKDGSVKKASIFFKPTVRPMLEISKASDALQALTISMGKRGRVDFHFICSIYPKKIAEIINELDSQIYLNPMKLTEYTLAPEEYLEAWEVSDEYLTGNVAKKLKQAEAIFTMCENEQLKDCLSKNIEALKQCQPPRLFAGDIKFQIGSSWIPVEIYNEFFHELFDVPRYLQNSIKVEHISLTGVWRIHGKSRLSYTTLAKHTYGTTRRSGLHILEDSLNLQQSTVNDRVVDGDKIRYVINPEETMYARQKQSEIELEFQHWLFADSKRTAYLLDIYNQLFNTTVPRKYDGSNLIFDGMNADIDLFPHQRNAVARIIYYRTALLAHEVGAGKTAEMLTAGMYLKQMGLINKPMYVVPNHLTEQWAKEILTFYPNANVLVTEKKDFEKSRRQEFVAKIATGDYDAIIIGMSQFERISLTLERQQEMIEREIDELTITIEQMKKENAERWTIKQIEAFRQKLMIRLSKLNNDEKRDKVIYFEDTGVDFLFIDEAHNYKNLFAYSKMKNVAGVSNSNSQRASDMLAKVRYIQEMHDGKNVVFATGTPISNSMSELYTMQRYLQPNVLEEKGLMLFDNWASTFGQVVSSLEITPEGGGYRMRNRFSKFHNLPELLNMFYEIADIQTAEMLDLPVPDLETGKVQTIVTEATDFQQQMMDEFVQRAEAIRAKEVSPDTDNMLKLVRC